MVGSITNSVVTAIVILIAGLLGTAVIQLTADESANLAEAYQWTMANGIAHPISPIKSKVHVRKLQRVGGKALMLFEEFNRCFACRFRLHRGELR